MATNPEAELPSGVVLSQMHRKRQTKHENETSKLLKEQGLSCPIPVHYVDLPKNARHPVFRVESYLRLLSLHNNLPMMLGHVRDVSMVREFWSRYKRLDPTHIVFSHHAGREQFVIPCYLHADEGRTLKKSSIMVCNLQPALGGNPDPEYDPAEMHTNMKFMSWVTRLLMFVMLKKIYKKDWTPFYVVVESLAKELLHLFEVGIDLMFEGTSTTFYICLLDVKGDWPILAKLGALERWFGRKTRTSTADAKGICHLCLAGTSSHPYHDCSDTARWRDTLLKHSPFKRLQPSPFACLPQHGAMMYRFDIFHCGQKGILAELAGSGLVISSVAIL